MNDSQTTITSLITINDEQIIHSPEWYLKLKTLVDDLIVNDFAKLVQVLYQIDVSEQKLKSTLQQYPAADAADIITKLMLERQLQRVKARKSFVASNKEFTTEERW